MHPSGHYNSSAGGAAVATATHCVFRRGSSWLALPALAVREALPRPDTVCVPGTPRTFAGLCHVRSEFIPVLNLDSVLHDQTVSADQIMLILDDDDGPWAVLVDEVSSLQCLEMSDAPETGSSEPGSAVVGWATSGDVLIQVLDQSRIRSMAENELSAVWQTREPQRQTPNSINSKISVAS